MKHFKQKMAMATFCAAVLMVIAGFNTAKEQTCGAMVVGIAWKKTSCTSSTVSNTFSYAAGYRAAYSAERNYATLTTQVKAGIKEDYDVDGWDVTTYSSSKPVGCVITYDKPMSGWNCSVSKAAVGFGNTATEAEADAVRLKKLDYSGGSYDVLGTVYCE